MRDLALYDIFYIYGEDWGTKLETYCNATKVQTDAECVPSDNAPCDMTFTAACT